MQKKYDVFTELQQQLERPSSATIKLIDNNEDKMTAKTDPRPSTSPTPTAATVIKASATVSPTPSPTVITASPAFENVSPPVPKRSSFVSNHIKNMAKEIESKDENDNGSDEIVFVEEPRIPERKKKKKKAIPPPTSPPPKKISSRSSGGGGGDELSQQSSSPVSTKLETKRETYSPTVTPPPLDLRSLNLERDSATHNYSSGSNKSSPPRQSPNSTEVRMMSESRFKLSNTSSSSSTSSLSDPENNDSGSGEDEGEYFISISCRRLDKLMQVKTPREHEVIPSHMLLQRWMGTIDFDKPHTPRNFGEYSIDEDVMSVGGSQSLGGGGGGGRRKRKNNGKSKVAKSPPPGPPPPKKQLVSGKSSPSNVRYTNTEKSVVKIVGDDDNVVHDDSMYTNDFRANTVNNSSINSSDSFNSNRDEREGKYRPHEHGGVQVFVNTT